MTWEGRETEEHIRPGWICRATVEAANGDMSPHTHFQRHFPQADVLRAIDHANLDCLEVLGDSEGELDAEVDEAIHSKAIYICKSAQVK
jgi:hypothetical protein